MSRSGGGFPLVRIGVPVAEGSLNLELFRGYELEPGSYDEVFDASAEDRQPLLLAASLLRCRFLSLLSHAALLAI